MAEENMGANNNMTGNEPGTNPDQMAKVVIHLY